MLHYQGVNHHKIPLNHHFPMVFLWSFTNYQYEIALALIQHMSIVRLVTRVTSSAQCCVLRQDLERRKLSNVNMIQLRYNHTYVFTYIYIHRYIHIYIYIYIRLYMYIQLYIYIHTIMCIQFWDT